MDISRRDIGLLAAATTAMAATPALAQRRAAAGGTWMDMVKAHHAEIDRLFNEMDKTAAPAARGALLKRIATALTGHSIAEEVALYPMREILGDEADGEALYDEQQDAKVALARLDAMPKAGEAFLTEFRAFATAVRAHVRHEEDRAYPDLMKKASAAQNAKMTADFRREYTRYING